MFPRYSKIINRSFGTHCGTGKTVGFVGLGCMGNPMSVNLIKNGFNVKGYDVSPEKMTEARDAGITTVDSIAECVTDCDYVMTALPRTHHVEDALKREGGILENIRADTMVCDSSTIDPKSSAGFGAYAAERGLTFIDTPMSGFTTGAVNGTLTFMVGGTEA